MSNSLGPHELQHARLPCLSPTPGACWNSCSPNWSCLPTISSSVVPLPSCLQSYPASGSYPMSPFFTSGGQSIGASASASVLPMNIEDWFPLGWTDLISLLPRDSQESSTPQFESINSLALHILYGESHKEWKSHPYMTTGKTIALTVRTFVGKVIISAFEYAV